MKTRWFAITVTNGKVAIEGIRATEDAALLLARKTKSADRYMAVKADTSKEARSKVNEVLNQENFVEPTANELQELADLKASGLLESTVADRRNRQVRSHLLPELDLDSVVPLDGHILLWISGTGMACSHRSNKSVDVWDWPGTAAEVHGLGLTTLSMDERPSGRRGVRVANAERHLRPVGSTPARWTGKWTATAGSYRRHDVVDLGGSIFECLEDDCIEDPSSRLTDKWRKLS